MALVRKFTIGVAPFAKMFRVHGMAGAACDALLQLRAKTLADDYFQEVGWNDDRTAFAVSNAALGNKVTMSEENISFTKDCHDSDRVFSFEKALSEFKIVYGAINSVLRVTDIRRIGMVAEYRLSVGSSNPSGWLREKLTTIPSKMLTEKFSLRFEERELAADGKAPDPKKADFINYIYHFYDSAQDTDHPEPGHVDANLDVQHYFAPVLNGSVPDEVLKLHRHFEGAQRRLDDRFKALGATHAKG